MIVLGQAHLRRIVDKYAAYYNESRIHRSPDKDAIHSIARLSASASSHPSLSSAAFITNIVESDFRHTQPAAMRSARKPSMTPARRFRRFWASVGTGTIGRGEPHLQ
jgi:hypothetical protein